MSSTRLPSDYAITHFISEGHLALDLINSLHFDYKGRLPAHDRLDLPVWLVAWTTHWHLDIASAPNPAALASLRALRTLLRGMMDAITTQQPITDAHLAELNTFLALTPVQQQVARVDGGVVVMSRPLEAGWTGVIAQVAAAWADLLSRMSFERLKVCANPDCHWAFIDHSHNLSRRWCRQ